MSFGTDRRRAVVRGRKRIGWRPVVEFLEPRRLPATFLVNTTFDTPAVDLDTGRDAAGNISLRSAVMAANANPGADEIVLPAGEFRVGGAFPDDDRAAVGDLDIHGPLTVVGQGREATRIRGNGQFFEVFKGPVDLQGVDLFVDDFLDRGPVEIEPAPAFPGDLSGGTPGDVPFLRETEGAGKIDLAAVVDAVARGLSPTAVVGGSFQAFPAASTAGGSVLESGTGEDREPDLRSRFGVGGPESAAPSSLEDMVAQTHRAFWQEPRIQAISFDGADREPGIRPAVPEEKNGPVEIGGETFGVGGGWEMLPALDAEDIKDGLNLDLVLSGSNEACLVHDVPVRTGLVLFACPVGLGGWWSSVRGSRRDSRNHRSRGQPRQGSPIRGSPGRYRNRKNRPGVVGFFR